MTDVNYEDIRPFDDSTKEWTDAEIATELAGQTPEPIDFGEGRQYHAEADWWTNSAPNTYTGAWQDAQNATPPQSIQRVLNFIWSVIFGVAKQDLGTTLQTKKNGTAKNKQQSGQLRDFLTWAVTNGYTDDPTVIAFYDNGGGLKYPSGVTAADVTQSRDTYTAEQAEQDRLNAVDADVVAAENEYVNPAKADPARTNQSVADAYRNAATYLETNA